MNLLRSCIFTIIMSMAVSCAIQVPPDGGLKDVKPPELVSSSPKNYSTDFHGKNIFLEFDENITLNELSSQLIVSPLLIYNPEIRVQKKSLLIHFLDTLLENTTYTMNFGEGISDNNEGNKLQDFQFVFSTGAVIDSLDVSGKILNAFDQKTEKGILVSLYNSYEDSVPYLERPLYFARTNDSGGFRINNVSPGSYKIIAMKESDGDYLYSGVNESIGFNDSLVNAGDENIVIESFEEIPLLRFLKSFSEKPGKAVLVFNAAADSVRLKWLGDSAGMKIYARSFSRNHDSLTIWYKNVYADSLNICFDNGSLNDTVMMRLFKKSDETFGKGNRGNLLRINDGNLQTTVQHLHLPHYLQANHPVTLYDFTKIIFMEDSLPVKAKYYFTDSLRMNLNIEYKWKDKSQYSLFIPPAAFTDIFDLKNDTVQLNFTSHEEKDYGSVKINFHQRTGDSYIMQLTDEAGTFIYRESFLNSDSTIEFSNIDPGRYRIKMISDRNRNRKWDTGNYLLHNQPEEISFYPEGILVRANWDVDISVAVPFSASTEK